MLDASVVTLFFALVKPVEIALLAEVILLLTVEATELNLEEIVL